MTKSIAEALADKYRLNAIPRLIPVKCVSVSPFQVVLEGGDEPVDALRVAGQSFAVNDRGMGLWAPPLAPICLKTT